MQEWISFVVRQMVTFALIIGEIINVSLWNKLKVEPAPHAGAIRYKHGDYYSKYFFDTDEWIYIPPGKVRAESMSDYQEWSYLRKRSYLTISGLRQ